MKVKEALIYQSAFPKSLISFEIELVISTRITHKGIIEVNIYLTLVTQVIAKASGPNKINFWVF